LMKLLVLVVAFSLFFTCFAAEEDVLVLTTENFDDAIKNNELILVEFYAPWCGHCKHLAPEYAQAAGELKGKAVLAKVDADNEQNRPLATRFEIRGFPTLKVFRNGEPTDYPGDRTAKSIVSYMKKQTQPAVRVLETEDDVTAFSKEERVAVVGFFADDSSPEYSKFSETANGLRDSFIFGAVLGPKAALLKKFEVEGVPTVVLFKDFDEGKNVLPVAEFDQISAWVKKHSVPLVDEIGPHNYKNYAEAGIPLGYLFVDLNVEGQLDEYLAFLKPIAVSSQGKVNWVYIDWQKYAKHSERLGLSGKTVPALAVEDLQTGLHYAFDETATISATSAAAWVESFLSGKLEPTIKSEPVPADNNGPVKIVVAKNFDQIVNDPTKDVFVEFYAPWCGHCKALAPLWEELGTELKGVESVVIAKIDATANDVNPSLGIKGFPTLKLFRANDKANPVDYNGDRTKADLIKFLNDNASVPIKEQEAVAKENKDEL